MSKRVRANRAGEARLPGKASIDVQCARVLTLWAAVVAEPLGTRLDDATEVMPERARVTPRRELAARACHLYERFRPAIPAGITGWGAKGNLDLRLIRHLAAEARA